MGVKVIYYVYRLNNLRLNPLGLEQIYLSEFFFYLITAPLRNFLFFSHKKENKTFYALKEIYYKPLKKKMRNLLLLKLLDMWLKFTN